MNKPYFFLKLCSYSLFLGCLFISLQTVAAAPDPLQQLVNAKPTNKILKSSPTFEGRGDGVHICPVSGEKITNKNLKAEHFGRTVYFCCEGCLKKAQREPDRYIKPSVAEQNKAVKVYVAKVPQAPAGDEYCNE